MEEPKASYTPIIAIAGGGVLASTYFYSQNLKRLGEKVITGKGRKSIDAHRCCARGISTRLVPESMGCGLCTSIPIEFE